MPSKPKFKCTCNYKQLGCAHFSGGTCKLTGNMTNCVMRTDSYHYRCCPMIKKMEGQLKLKIIKTPGTLNDYNLQVRDHNNNIAVIFRINVPDIYIQIIEKLIKYDQLDGDKFIE